MEALHKPYTHLGSGVVRSLKNHLPATSASFSNKRCSLQSLPPAKKRNRQKQKSKRQSMHETSLFHAVCPISWAHDSAVLPFAWEYLFISPVGFKGNLSLPDMCVFSSRGRNRKWRKIMGRNAASSSTKSHVSVDRCFERFGPFFAWVQHAYPFFED